MKNPVPVLTCFGSALGDSTRGTGGCVGDTATRGPKPPALGDSTRGTGGCVGDTATRGPKPPALGGSTRAGGCVGDAVTRGPKGTRASAMASRHAGLSMDAWAFMQSATVPLPGITLLQNCSASALQFRPTFAALIMAT
jgi:hypothetical protein